MPGAYRGRGGGEATCQFFIIGDNLSHYFLCSGRTADVAQTDEEQFY